MRAINHSSAPRTTAVRTGRPSARRVAWEILLRVETQASFATELLNSPIPAGLDERDAALATELVMGALRHQTMLDFLARRHANRWDSLDPEVRVALRLGVYQLWFLCRTQGRMPARAAIFETVEVVKQVGKRSAAGFVNAVLRKSASEVSDDISQLRPPEMSELDWLSVYYSHPAWLLQRWIDRCGRADALELARCNNQAPTAYLRLPAGGRNAEETEQELAKAGVEVSPGKFLNPARALVRGNLVRTEAYRKGEVVLQDEASQVVPYLLDVQEGHRVLDLCAAPGNKTSQLAEFAGQSGRVVACDVHLHRLQRMQAPGCGTTVARVAVDGERHLPFAALFNRILVDAPCCGTGTLARNPEIKWRLRQADIEQLSAKQLRLLSNAAPMLKPGGRMVYSVCSLEPEEGREAVQQFLASHPDFHLLPLRDDATRLKTFVRAEAQSKLENDFFETSPRDETDGFFAAILVKRASV